MIARTSFSWGFFGEVDAGEVVAVVIGEVRV